MKYYGKAEQAINTILDAFKDGKIPGAIAQVYIHKNQDLPCNNWSFRNQLLVALSGTHDARGFNQWKKVGRRVKKGGKAFPILIPLFTKKKVNEGTKDEKEEQFLYGFKSTAVFGIEMTEITDSDLWAAEVERCLCGQAGEDLTKWISDLPMLEVAKAWDINVTAYSGKGTGALGYYKHGYYSKSIAMGVKNLSTWAHEMIHAADYKNNTNSDRASGEVVAELGGAALLEMLGFTKESDRGGCWDYIKGWSHKDGIKLITACQRLMTRIAKNIDLILETAENVNGKAVKVKVKKAKKTTARKAA